MEDNTKTPFENYLDNFSNYTYTKKAGVFIGISVAIALFGLLFMGSYDTFGFAIFLEIVAGTMLTIAVDYLIAKEFEHVATEKGYEGKRYFWYSFILGLVGYLLVIALPKK